MILPEGDLHNKWMKYQSIIKSNLNGIIKMDGIEMKRTHFMLVSDELSKLLKEFDVIFSQE